MSRACTTRTLCCLAALPLVSIGCTTVDINGPPQPSKVNVSAQKPPPKVGVKPTSVSRAQPIQLASHEEPAEPENIPGELLVVPRPPSQDGLLSLEDFLREVQERNPTLAQMTAAWQAASARPTQVASLDDPMFGASVGPGSFGSNEVDTGYRVEVSQKFPFPGKLDLKCQAASAEAAAAGNDLEEARIRLVESARTAFYDYYLVERALAVNNEALRLLNEFRDNAENRYRTGLVPAQDVLQADVEIGRQRERGLTLKRMREVVIARINTLRHLSTNTFVSPAPEELQLFGTLPDVHQLQATAIARRPELKAIADRIAAEQANLALAHREYYPDFEAVAAYDAFWQEKPLRPMIGMRMNVPLRKMRRNAAVSEAEARIAQRQAELSRQTDQVNLEVQEATSQVQESLQIVQLYEKTLLPAAEANVKAAQAAYTTGKIPFLSLIESQRNVISLKDRHYEALADAFRRRATLERAVGGMIEN